MNTENFKEYKKKWEDTLWEIIRVKIKRFHDDTGINVKKIDIIFDEGKRAPLPFGQSEAIGSIRVTCDL